MTPQQIADQITELESKLAGLRDLQKAARPALAAGQVWTFPRTGEPWGVGLDGALMSLWDSTPWEGDRDRLVYEGLARDVLRVVQPDAVEQVAPVQDEPTGDHLNYPALLRLATEKACRIVALMYPAGDPRIKDRVESITIGIFTEYCISPLYREGVTP